MSGENRGNRKKPPLLSKSLGDIGTEEGYARVRAYLDSQPFPQFEASAELPGYVVKVDRDGARTVGRLSNDRREFVPVNDYPLDEKERVRLGLEPLQRPRRKGSRASRIPEENSGSGGIRLSIRRSWNTQEAEAPRSYKCSRCGSPMSVHREDVSYDMSGLRGITLENLMVYRCRTCSASDVAIPAIEQLHGLLASRLAKKPAPLDPREIRFLRKYLGHSGAEFARKLGVRASTVLGWERQRAPKAMQASVERRIRAMASRRATVNVVTSAWNAHA